MLELKNYQRRCIEELTDYLAEARKQKNPKVPFITKTDKPYNVLHGDPSVPFVCIRVPTGGGKTLIAAHAVATAFGHYLLENEERGLVLWLVPSDAIRTQTLAQLRNRLHPYREALDQAFDSRVRVMDIMEARSIKPSDITENICVVVTTLGSVRREETEGLKVYQQNGSLMEHFRGTLDGDLFKDENSTVIQSLANVIRKNRPLVILDEGHNAQTTLSVDVLKEFLPSCIIEFTATPLAGSNILVSISAVELKNQHMVKIPIELSNITQWQEAIQKAVEKRDELEKIAEKERKASKDYVRPILLLQAEMEQAKEDKIHVRRIVDFLTEELKVKREEIAIKTGEDDELKAYSDLLSPSCPIRYIVTCAALKEGWDCSFAYVLASVSNLGTRLGVEQLIGRILRLPQAKKKTEEALNRSYVFTSSRRFDDAAKLVVASLQQEGYDKHDVIRSGQKEQGDERKAVREVTEDDFSLPYLALDGQPLDFYDLIPEDFTLKGKATSVELLKNLENQTFLIDVQEDAVVTTAQQKLGLLHLSAEETKDMLIRWLTRAVREQAVDRSDMAAFIKEVLNGLLKKQKLSSLYARKFALRDAITALIRQLLEEEAERQFGQMLKAGRLTPSKEEWRVPKSMTLLHPMEEPWERHLFDISEELNCTDLNDSEIVLARQLDDHPNVDWWLRNVVQDPDGFRLQGFKRNGFYPDFIVRTKDKKWWVLEYKGADRASNDDSDYKKHLGETWAKVCGKDCSFRLVEKSTIGTILSSLLS
ncbi:MAG: DEAD/DEAH box helicase family protein [Candidatus Peribacteraceae bacterium]|nr:DEAD/DEAH box helicase family protein [Candidatus Peribacteraceae bacterium]